MNLTYPEKKDPITTSEEFYGTSSSDDNPSKGLEYMRGTDRSSVTEDETKEVEQEYKKVNQANFDNIDAVMTSKAEDEQGRIVAQQVFNKTIQLQQQPETPDDFIERVQTDVKDTTLEIEEDELLVNPTWNESGRILKTFLESTRSDKSDGEFALQLGNEMFANIGGANVSGEGTRLTGGLLPLATKAVNSGDENVINALLYTMEMYDRKPMTSRGWVDGVGYLLGDASNYIGLGFVANATRHTVGKQAGNSAVKGMLQEALTKIATSKVGQVVAKHPVGTEAVKQGALWSAVDELGKEIVTARSGVRGNNEIDLTNIAGAGVAGGIVGLGLVTIPPAIWRKGSKEVREYINRSLRREHKGLKTFKRIAGEQSVIGDEAGGLPQKIDVSGTEARKIADETIRDENFKSWFGDSKVVDEDGEPLVVYHGTANEITEFDTSFGGDTTANNDYGAFYFSNESQVAEDYSRQAMVRRYEDRDLDELMGYHELSEDQAQKIIDDLHDTVEERIKTVPAFLKFENPLVVTKYDGGNLELEEAQKYVGYAKENIYDDDIVDDIGYENLYTFDKDDVANNIDEIRDRAIENNGLESVDEIEDYMLEDATQEVLDESGLISAVEYDGVIFKNVIDDIGDASSIFQDVYVAFEPNQIKSVNNSGAFSDDGNILKSALITTGLGIMSDNKEESATPDTKEQ